MLKVDKTLVVGWEPAIRGMRNPLESWDRSDSGDRCSCKQELEDGDNHFPYCLEGYRHKKDEVIVGPNDLELMMKLCKAGSDHRKFMRMLIVYADITAPLYWWKEYDTYKVGTVANSCSTMHTIHKKEFTMDDFSHDKLFRPEDVTILPIEEVLRRLSFYLNCANSMSLVALAASLSSLAASTRWAFTVVS